MGKGEQIKQDLEQFAHDEKNRVMRHDDKEDVKKKLSHEDKAENFTASSGITSDEASKLLAEWGPNELQEKKQSKLVIYLKLLVAPMPIMIWLAIFVEVGITIANQVTEGSPGTNWIDAVILLAIQFINATLGWYETIKAADAVAALKASLKPKATVKRDGKWQEMDATLVVPGDLVLLCAGAAVPADCIVNEGRIEVDQSALTGESLPVTMVRGSRPKMGSTITRGEVEGTVEFTGKHTFFGKTAMLLAGDDDLGSLQKLLLKIMFVLIVLSCTLCLTALLYLAIAKNEPFTKALSFAVVLLVASIPIAIEIVCTTTLALGSRDLSKHGAIVTRLASIEEMAGMNMLCSDKTGTLTLNTMMIQEHCPTYSEYATDYKGVVQYAALAAKWKEPPKDALDTMVLGACDLATCDQYEMLDHQPFDPILKRTESTIKGPDGKTFKVTKGAPQIVAALVNDETVRERVRAEVQLQGAKGVRCLSVAITTDPNMSKWVMLGVLTFLDPPRPDTKATIDAALEAGVDVKMVTGDQVLIAKEMSRILGLGTNIPDAAGLPELDENGKAPADLKEKYGNMILEADGFAQVFPEHKYLIVEALRQMGFAVGMTGDGVNDAPALKKADVGIAVSGATDAARAAADIVLTEPGLSVLIHAIFVARCIFQRVQNFINYRIAATLQLLIFFFITVFAFPPDKYYCENRDRLYFSSDGEEHKVPTGFVDILRYDSDGQLNNKTVLFNSDAYNACENDYVESCNYELKCPSYFQLPVILLLLITVLNDGTLISVGYDRAKPSPRPEKWNLRVLFTASSVLGLVSMGTSLLMLWAALDSPSAGSLFAEWGLPVPAYGQIVTMIYLKVSLSDFLTLFAARTSPGGFWSHRPGIVLFIAATIALGISTILGCLWPRGQIDGVQVQGLNVHENDDYENYNLWPLWVWIYCIVFFFVQDLLKVIFYWIMLKFDIFEARTGALVNVRGYTSPGQSEVAAKQTGAVEAKLLGRRLDNAISGITSLVKRKGGKAPASLARASATMAIARTSISALDRPSPVPGVDEAAIKDIKQAVKDAEGYLDPEDQKALDDQIDAVQRAANNLERVSAVAMEKK
jgi:H+-transporting ATPase